MNNPIKGRLRAVQDRVIISDMHFGEVETSSGIILRNDDGKTHGVHPRWGKVYDKGPKNKAPYKIGDWVLVEHGRWTRGAQFENGEDELTLRMVEPEAIIMFSTEKPEFLALGEEFSNGQQVY